MMQVTYKLNCESSAEDATKRIESLLCDEGVKSVASPCSIVTTSTPFVLLGIQRNLYSHNNWTGINPFAFVSGLAIEVLECTNGTSVVTVSINRRRAFYFMVFWAACGLFASIAVIGLLSIFVFVAMASLGWLCIIVFIGGYLIKKEINDKLQAKGMNEARSGSGSI